MGVIIDQLEVVKMEGKYIVYGRVDLHLRQGPGSPGKLLMHLVKVIPVNVYIPEGMDKIAGLEAAHLGHHHGQKCIGGYIKGYAQKHIG